MDENEVPFILSFLSYNVKYMGKSRRNDGLILFVSFQDQTWRHFSSEDLLKGLPPDISF